MVLLADLDGFSEVIVLRVEVMSDLFLRQVSKARNFAKMVVPAHNAVEMMVNVQGSEIVPGSISKLNRTLIHSVEFFLCYSNIIVY